MSFIQAGFLFAGLAVVIPLIVHLLNRWQVKRIELGTMRFLSEVIRDGVQRRRVRRWFLLLTRMALVGLIAALFARPFFLESTKRDGDRFRVILIDRSASMSMPGRQGRLVDDAVAEAIKRANALGEDAKVEWAWFDRQIEPVLDDGTRLIAPRVLTGGTNFAAAIAYARDRVHAHPTSLADVFLISDMQRSGLNDNLSEVTDWKFPVDVPVHVVDVGRPAASNLAITSVVAPATRLRSQRACKVTATLFNYGSLPFEDVPVVVIATNGSRTVQVKKSIQSAPGQPQEVEFDLGALDVGVWQCTVSVDVNDDLALDNQRYVAFEVAKPYTVLVLDRRGDDQTKEELAHNPFLIAALQQNTDSFESSSLSDNEERGISEDSLSSELSRTKNRVHGRFEPRWVSLDQESFPYLDIDETRLVVVSNFARLNASDIDRLEDYAQRGGRLLIFAGDPAREDWQTTWASSAIAPGTLGKQQPSGVSPFRIVSFESTSDMLDLFEDPQHGDLKRLAFHKIQHLFPASETRVLAWFEDKKPAITSHTFGKGNIVWFLSSSDPSWSNWTMSPLYLPLVQQMAAELLQLNGEGLIRFRNVGDSILAKNEDVQLSERNTVQTVSLATDSSTSVGMKTFSQAGFDKSTESLYVINTSASESDTARIEPNELGERFGITVVAGDELDKPLTSVTALKRIEIWPWLAGAILVLLIAEFALSNRTTP
ncbi:BatA domain-containing protein [Pirellulaceae bacterium SH449]